MDPYIRRQMLIAISERLERTKIASYKNRIHLVFADICNTLIKLEHAEENLRTRKLGYPERNDMSNAIIWITLE